MDYIYPPPSSLKKNREDESSEEEEFAETDSLEEESQETPELSTALIEAPDEPEESDLVRKLREERYLRTREKFGKQLRDGKLEDKPVEISVKNRTAPLIEIFSPGGIEEMDINFKDVFGGMMPKQTKKRRVTISEARQILMQEEAEKLIDMDNVVGEAIARVENTGLVFLDEIDKIAGREYKAGPDVSREGVQRDILPIIEGCTVATKYGMVRTDHILFIAAGAFHMSKPSDLIPELQGRFPIRVELQSLGEGDFKRILTEPKNALVKQYIAMMETEDLNITISDDAIDEISALAYRVNEAVEDIGARRLHTIMEKLFEEISFEAPDLDDKDIVVDAQYVNGQLSDIVKDEDLSKYIL